MVIGQIVDLFSCGQCSKIFLIFHFMSFQILNEYVSLIGFFRLEYQIMRQGIHDYLLISRYLLEFKIIPQQLGGDPLEIIILNRIQISPIQDATQWFMIR